MKTMTKMVLTVLAVSTFALAPAMSYAGKDCENCKDKKSCPHHGKGKKGKKCSCKDCAHDKADAKAEGEAPKADAKTEDAGKAAH